MKLKATYDTPDEIPEAFRPLYEERGGKHQLTQIEGIVTSADVDRVQRALAAERTAHGTVKQTLTSILGDRKPEDLQAMLDKYPELEAAAAGKMDEAKLNEIAEARARAKLGPVERAKADAERKLQEALGTISQYETRERTRTIHDHVRTAAVKSKVLDTAQEDVLLLAERIFEVDETGKVVTRDGVGVTPGISAETWLTDMQKARPHWWPASSGGGARGSGTGGGGGSNPWSHDSWNMTEQGKVVREHGLDKAREMAKAAGTTLGGQRPAKK